MSHPAPPLPELAFPVESYPLVDELAIEPEATIELLRTEVVAYQAVIREESERNVMLDATMALEIGDGCLVLLDGVDDDTSDVDRRLIQLATRYYVLKDDADSDLESFLGFEDDAKVFNVVAAHLGRDDLHVPVP